MRQILIFMLAVSFATCGNTIFFEKDYYEKITGIKFPDKYKVLETFDNGEWLTGTVFAIDNETLRKFISDNNFDTVQNLWDIRLISSAYFVRKPNFITTKNIFLVNKSKTSMTNKN